MGIQKDQSYFGEDLETSEKTNRSGELSPHPNELALLPQAQKSLAEGPVFDFLAPAVLLAEQALGAAVLKLKGLLEVSAKDCNHESGYLNLSRELNHTIPELYLHYDAFVKAVLETGKEKVSCARACSHCCSHYVTSVEPYELIFLHSKIHSDNRYPGQLISLHRRVSMFKSLLKGGFDDTEQAADEDKALYRYYLRGQPCPFLAEGGACGIYENRPMSCRMFYSLSHPSLCKGKAVIAPGNRNFLIELPEAIEADLARAGVLFASLDLPESLFEGLLSVNEIFGQFDHGEKL